jgi:hypothetical protein
MRGIDPEVWGPSGWKLLHGITFRKGVKVTKSWIMTFRYVLPCCTCQENFRRHTEALGDIKQVRRWVYKLHGRVNEMKGKSNPSYSEVARFWRENPLTWGDIMTFLDAVIETHQGKGKINAQKALEFWEGLLKYMGMPVENSGLSLTVVESRHELRVWWKKYQRQIYLMNEDSC